MDYMHLGRTGLKVSRLALGTMNFGELTDKATSLSPRKSSAAGWRRTVGASGSCWRPKYISRWKRGRTTGIYPLITSAGPAKPACAG
jgi:hypothetical protein